MPSARSRLGRLLPTSPIDLREPGRLWPWWVSRRPAVRALLVLALAAAVGGLHFIAVRARVDEALPWLCILLLATGAVLPWTWTAALGLLSSVALVAEGAWLWSAYHVAPQPAAALAPLIAAAIAVALAAARRDRPAAVATPPADAGTPDAEHARVLRQQAALAGLAQRLLPQALLPALQNTAQAVSATMRLHSTEVWGMAGTHGGFELLATDRRDPDAPRQGRLSPHVVAALRQGGIVEIPAGAAAFEVGGPPAARGGALLALTTTFGAPAGFVYAVAPGPGTRRWFPDEHLFLAACAANVSLALETESRRATESRLESEVLERLSKEREAVRLNAELAGHVERRTADLERATLAHIDLQEALRRASADWTATFDSMQFPLLLLDEAAVLVRCNHAACLGLGRQSYVEVLGRTLGDLSTREPWRSIERLALDTAARAQPQTLRVAEDGRTWKLSASVVSATPPRRVAVLVVEVTRILALQEAIQRANRLSAVGTLVAGVAHEVRNPLFAMSASLDCLEEEVAGLGANFAGYVQSLRHEMGRVERLMRDLLDYARPPAANPRSGSVVAVAEAAVASRRKLQRERGAAIAVAVTGEPAFEITMDADRLEQVFANLVENALHFTPPAGEVRLEIAFGTATVEVAVLDQGPGFAAADLEHVFEPLFSRRRGGTGLGLAIAQRIVDEHGGRIAAGNRAEGGGRVAVVLPRWPAGVAD